MHPSPSAAQDPDPQAAYAALLAHDARFDGHWFVGVTTTGIYCRPVCRVRPPLQPHCRFFRNAALAEQAGFRPCLRCRPEQAPGLSRVDSSGVLARHAARRLVQAVREGEPLPLPALAAELGVTDRHLRRIFQAEHGVSPMDFLGTQRLLQAKQLLTDTDWPVTTVALASGFASLRRFHAAFAQRYRLQPTRWRRTARPAADGDVEGHASAGGMLELSLAYRPPYDQAGTLHFLSRRQVAGVEALADSSSGHGPLWRRTLALDHEGERRQGWIEIGFAADADRLTLRVSSGLAAALGKVIQRVRDAFDLDADPHAVGEALRDLPVPPPAGLRLIGSMDGFEAAVRVVLGQQVSVAAARTLTARLVDALGESIETPFAGLSKLFPSARSIADAPAETLGRLGIVRQRVAALQALARAVDEGELRLQPGAPLQATRARLLALPGVGDWTAELIALRALGWPDAFPAGDLGVRQALMPALDASRSRRDDTAFVLAQAEAWRPWRGYAVVALWRGLDPPPGAEPDSARTAPPRPAPLSPSPQGHAMPLRTPTPLATRTVHTPLGRVLLAATDRGLAGLWFEGQQHHPGDALDGRTTPGPHPVLDATAAQLADYFAGSRRDFDLPLDPWGGTPLQRGVWQVLSSIPPGQTRRYGEIAAACGRPTAVRAVAAAIGRNPISIVVPCHRVIGARGQLTGYAGGLDRKAALLSLEARLEARLADARKAA